MVNVLKIGGGVKSRKAIMYHIGAWSVFVIYEIGGMYVINHVWTSIPDYICHYSLSILLFYFNAHVVYPFAIKNNKPKYPLLIPLILAEMAAAVVLSYSANVMLEAMKFAVTWPITHTRQIIAAATWRSIYILSLSTGYWFAVHFFESAKRNIALIREQMVSQQNQLTLEKEIVKSENAYLQAQVNPHLLFNTLNYIYNSVEEFSQNAAEAVMLLSDISRYSMKNPDEDGLVFLADEIKQIENIIRLNQLRFSKKLCIDYKAEGNFTGLKIAPLIILNFVENMFKHGDFANAQAPAYITVTTLKDDLIFEIRNKKSRRARISHGIGIANTKTRLDMRYPDKYILNIDNDNDYYTLDLRLRLDYAKMLHS